MSHEEHMKQMNERGNLAMGFDQQKATHHFALTRTGGTIEVGVNQAGDEETRKQVRDHLRMIASQFADGVFTRSIATHGEVPAGVPAMRRKKSRIRYIYEETPQGARVVIGAADRSALTAVHEFLEYQIREHATGDPLPVLK